jgi:U3 small nucleolar RNA-associated protein 11
MSSMRNAVQRRNHKERAQPEERQKWGLLEKRKVNHHHPPTLTT